MENQSCFFNGQPYSHGSTVCSNNSELICINGNWDPTGKNCNSDSVDMAEVLDKTEFQDK